MSPRPRCQDPECPNYGDPDFGEATCPEEHAIPRRCSECPSLAEWFIFSRGMRLLSSACEAHLVNVIRDRTTDPRIAVVVRFH